MSIRIIGEYTIGAILGIGTGAVITQYGGTTLGGSWEFSGREVTYGSVISAFGYLLLYWIVRNRSGTMRRIFGVAAAAQIALIIIHLIWPNGLPGGEGLPDGGGEGGEIEVA